MQQQQSLLCPDIQYDGERDEAAAVAPDVSANKQAADRPSHVIEPIIVFM